MSKYIKLEDAIEAYNQAVKELVESEMEEFDLGDFTECQFDTTQIKLIARMIADLPTIEVSEDCISREWILEEFQKGIGIISKSERFDELKWLVTHAPSVVPTTEQSSKVGKWIADRYCSECEWDKSNADYTSGWTENYCPNCGAKMKV